MARSRRSAGEAGGAGEAGAAEPTTPSFEQALSALEAVVGRLESGDMPLEQALEAFESGIKLSRQCAATLDAAERRIEILMAERGGAGLRVAPLGGDPEAEDPDGSDDLFDSNDENGER